MGRMRRLPAIVMGLGALLVLGACGGDDEGTSTNDAREAHALTRYSGPGDEVTFAEKVTFRLRGAQIDSAEVLSADGRPLKGKIGDDGQAWTSTSRPEPGASYDVTLAGTDRFGREHTFTDEFTVEEVPDGDRLTLAMQPSNETVVGVGAPIVVHFDQPVTNRKAVEREMHVSSDPQVVGSWHWVSETQARFRPKEYWPAGTKVALDLELNGVKAGDNLWGGRSYHLTFEVGDSHVARVNADTHTMRVNVNGSTKHTWDTSLGAPDFATRNGTYVVLEKFEERNMTSCNANIACDPSDPDYYDVDTDWAVRLSYSGTFVHSAPWSVDSQGQDNVSHGCINLNDKNAETFFRMARYGDVVTVKNSTRNSSDLVARADPGMVDWNQPWKEFVAGSALGKQIKTGKL